MRTNWERSVQNVLRWEGGWAERPNEPGGYVNKGISLTVFKEWRKSKGLPEPTKEDLKKLSDEEAKEIYWHRFAEPIGFDLLPSGYDYALLTAAVMQGPSRGKPEEYRPGAKWLHEQAKGDLGRLVVLQMWVKMHDPNVGPHKNPVTGKDEFYGPGWSDRFLSEYDLAREMQGDGVPVGVAG